MSGGETAAGPGAFLPGDGEIVTGEGAAVLTLTVTNTGDRPIQVGSHVHFSSTNPALAFDREAATGMRLAIHAGTSVRFEPGVEKDVTLVALGGSGTVPGLRLDVDDPAGRAGGSPGSGWTVGREAYAELFGPTTGDRLRLADTDLTIRVESDRSRGPAGGDEAVFGGGKVIRESMGQTVAGKPHVLPSSTNPTRPHTVNTVDEHLDMLMVCHHLSSAIPEDLAFAESRIRASTIAAEDLLHDLGAISMIGSDSQAMGRVGEVVLRTWQTAHAAKRRVTGLSGVQASGDDNERARRYVAKYTICPAIAHGLDGEVGSVEVGKLADLVLWDPAFFGVRPHVVVKGGVIAWGRMGDANASIPTPQPELSRPMFGAFGQAPAATSVHFATQAALDGGLAGRVDVRRRFVPVRSPRSVSKADMPGNDAMPEITVDPETFTVRIDGSVVDPDPVRELPMAQRYFLF